MGGGPGGEGSDPLRALSHSPRQYHCRHVNSTWAKAVFLGKLIKSSTEIEQEMLLSYPDKTVVWKDTCTPMFITALFTIAKTWKQSKCPLTDEWVRKMWYIYNGILLSHKKEHNNTLCSNVDGPRDNHTKWNKKETNTIWYHLYVESKIQHNEHIFKAETHLQTKRADFWLLRGWWGEGRLGSLDKQRDPTVEQRGLLYIQYPVINQNEKEYEEFSISLWRYKRLSFSTGSPWLS